MDFDNIGDLNEHGGDNPGFSDAQQKNVKRSQESQKYFDFLQANDNGAFPYKNADAYSKHLGEKLFKEALSRFGDQIRNISSSDFNNVASVSKRRAVSNYRQIVETINRVRQNFKWIADGASGYEDFANVVGDFGGAVSELKRHEADYVRDGLSEIEKKLKRDTTPISPVIGPHKPGSYDTTPVPRGPVDESFVMNGSRLGDVRAGWFLKQLWKLGFSNGGNASSPSPAFTASRKPVEPISEASSLWTKFGTFLETSVLSDIQDNNADPEVSLKNALDAIGLKVGKSDFKPLLARIVQRLGIVIEEEVVENERLAQKPESEFSKKIKEQGKATRKRIKDLVMSLQSLGLEKVGLRLPLEEDLKPLSKKRDRTVETAQTIRDILQKHSGLRLSDIEKAAKFYGMPFDRYIADRFLFANRKSLGGPGRPDLDAILGVAHKNGPTTEKEQAFQQFKERLESIGLDSVSLSLPSDNVLRGLMKRQDETFETFSTLKLLKTEQDFSALNLKDYAKVANYKGLFFDRNIAQKLNATNPGVLGGPGRPDLDAILGINAPVKPKSVFETSVDNFLAELKKEVGAGLDDLGFNPYDSDTAARIVRDKRGKQAIESIKTYLDIAGEYRGIGLGGVAKIAKIRGIEGFSPKLIRALAKNNISKNLDGELQGQELVDLEAVIREILETDSGESDLVAAKRNADGAKRSAKSSSGTSGESKSGFVLEILRAFGRQGVAPKIGGVVEVFKRRAKSKDSSEESFVPVSSDEIRATLESVANQIKDAKDDNGAVDASKVNLEEASKIYKPGTDGIFGAGYDIARSRKNDNPPGNDPDNGSRFGGVAFWGKIGLGIAAIGAFALAIKKAAGAVAQFGTKTLETVAKYAPYSGGIMEANAVYQTGDFWRNVNYAQGVEKSTSGLLDAWGELKDSSLDIQIAFKNLYNELGILAIDGLLPLIQAVNDFIAWLKGKTDEPPKEDPVPQTKMGLPQTGPTADFAGEAVRGFIGLFKEEEKKAEELSPRERAKRNSLAIQSAIDASISYSSNPNKSLEQLNSTMNSVREELRQGNKNTAEIVRNTEPKTNEYVSNPSLYKAIANFSEFRFNEAPGVDVEWKGKLGHEKQHGRDAKTPENLRYSTNKGLNKQ